jgi:hypothetical protein
MLSASSSARRCPALDAQIDEIPLAIRPALPIPAWSSRVNACSALPPVRVGLSRWDLFGTRPFVRVGVKSIVAESF